VGAVSAPKSAGWGEALYVRGDQREVGVLRRPPGQWHILRIRETIAPQIGHSIQTHIGHLTAQDRAARADDAAEKDRIGRARPDLGQERLVVQRKRRQVLATEDGAAGRGEGRREDVGDASSVRLVIVDDERAPKPAVAREPSGGGRPAGHPTRRRGKTPGDRDERRAAAAQRDRA